jgi:hypothetical protein
MRKLKYKILVFILSFPMTILSQEWFDRDSLELQIIAYESYDTRSKDEGFRDFYKLSHEVDFNFNSESNVFFSKKVKRWKCFQVSNYDTIVKHNDDSTYINRSHAISKNVILNLIKELDNDKCCKVDYDDLNPDSQCCNLSNEDYEIDEKWLKKNINRRTILKRAKMFKRDWEFKNQYSMREDRERFYKGYSNMDSLNTFLNDFRKPEAVKHLGHTLKRLWINVVHKQDTLISLTKIVYPLYEQTSWINNRNKKEIYNPKINLIVSEMLPKQFLYKNLIKREFIKESYLDWILKRWN